jgi:heme-degrading monooxygenase HmoA
MYARVTHFHILPGKLTEFSQAVQSLMPELVKQKGFRGLLVVHTQTADPIEVEVLSLWDTQEDLDATERNLSFYHALARVQGFAQGFPSIHVHQVLVSKFP